MTEPSSYFANDPRQQPLYTTAAVSRWIDVPAPTIASWVRGRTYRRADGTAVTWRRLIEPPADPGHRLSFWNLLELQALRALRSVHEVDIQAVREALEISRQEHGIDRLLIHQDLRTLAGELFLEHYGKLIHLSRSDRFTLGAIWASLADRIDFGRDGLGKRLRPRLSDAPEISSVLLDPAVAFGRPTLRGVRVDVVRSRFEAGEDLAIIANDYGFPQTEVEQAIQFDRLAAA